MREQLIRYINGLFAGSTGAEDIQQEILQDTLDKYDDLIAQGVSPEEAYRQAAESVGDVQALLDELNPQGSTGGAGDSVKVNPVKVFRSASGNSIQIFVGKKGKDASNAREFRPEDVDNLEIDWVSGDVFIATAQQDTITVREELARGDAPMVVSQSGGRLSVRFSERKNIISKDKDLFITVPRAWRCKWMKVTMVSADLHCNDLTFTDTVVNTASGDSSFDECHLETLRVDSASGDIHYIGNLKILSVDVASGDLSYSGGVEKLDFDSASGDAEVILRGKPKELSFDMVSGDLDLTLPEDCGFTLKRSTVTGDFDSEFAMERDGKRRVYGDGACQIKTSSVSGDISIHKGS